MESKQFGVIPEGFNIPYGEETHKRTFVQLCVKVKNTILGKIAYSCPTSSWRVRLHRWRGVHIGQGAYIGMRCYIDNLYPELIYIEDNASINANSVVLTHFNPRKVYSRIIHAEANPVLIKKYSVISVNSIIMPGTTIGEYAMVAAGSVVYDDVEDKTLVRGNPAKKVGKLKL